VVGIDDVAEALLLAAERGRIGQRYIISQRYMTQRELVTIAANAVGARPPRLGIPMALVYGVAQVSDVVGSLLHRDIPISKQSARLIELTSPASHDKATRELGWYPKPTEEYIARAAHEYVARSRAAS
jgi:nucleoside-diphosphate-sugar epimerase